VSAILLVSFLLVLARFLAPLLIHRVGSAPAVVAFRALSESAFGERFIWASFNKPRSK